jgi:hypothetical protein
MLALSLAALSLSLGASPLGFGQRGRVPAIFDQHHGTATVRYTETAAGGHHLPTTQAAPIYDVTNRLVLRAAHYARLLHNHAAPRDGTRLAHCRVVGGTQRPGIGVRYQLALRCMESSGLPAPFDADVTWASWQKVPYVLHSFTRSARLPTVSPTQHQPLRSSAVAGCRASTEGSCTAGRSCEPWRNAQCVEGRCVCPRGRCAVRVAERGGSMCMDRSAARLANEEIGSNAAGARSAAVVPPARHHRLNVKERLAQQMAQLKATMSRTAAGSYPSLAPGAPLQHWPGTDSSRPATTSAATPSLRNIWGDAPCQAWISQHSSRCSAGNYKANCAAACAAVVDAAAAAAAAVAAAAAAAAAAAPASLVNKWGDSSCAAWIAQSPTRCGAGNYKANCAKTCAGG